MTFLDWPPALSAMDWIAGPTAAYASACLQLRAQALKPEMEDYPSGPGSVRWALFLLSVVLGAYALVVLIGHYDAQATETLLVCAIAYPAHVLWRNVRKQSVSRAAQVSGGGDDA